MINKIISCKCGHWYNTSTKCPNCNTLADKKWTEKVCRKDYIQNMIDKRINVKRRIQLEIDQLEKELKTIKKGENDD